MPCSCASTCRVFPDGKVQYLHPADGVYPEKVNAGRVGVNQNMRSIGENVNPIKVGTGVHPVVRGWARRSDIYSRRQHPVIIVICARALVFALEVSVHAISMRRLLQWQRVTKVAYGNAICVMF